MEGGGDPTTGPGAQRTRSTASRRLLDHQHTSQLSILGGGIGPSTGAHWPPSRRREEARALENLSKRVNQGRLASDGPSTSAVVTTVPRLDNRPMILQKVHFVKMQKLSNFVVFTQNYYNNLLTGKEYEEIPNGICVTGGSQILSNKPGIVSEQEELGTDWLDSDFIAECLCWHNVYRQRHRVASLTLCPQLCQRAQSWANHLAHTNTFFYQQAKDVGQNLFCRLTNTLQTDLTGQEVASYWYSAVRQYTYMKEPDVLHANVNAGHFTQLVWASTKLFGVGKARSRSGKILVVANYRPPGNITGLFKENVLPPVPEYEDMTSMSGSDSSNSRSAELS